MFHETLTIIREGKHRSGPEVSGGVDTQASHWTIVHPMAAVTRHDVPQPDGIVVGAGMMTSSLMWYTTLLTFLVWPFSCTCWGRVDAWVTALHLKLSEVVSREEDHKSAWPLVWTWPNRGCKSSKITILTSITYFCYAIRFVTCDLLIVGRKYNLS